MNRDEIENGKWCSQSGFLGRDGKCRSPDGCFCRSMADTLAQLEDAKTAQALVLERAAEAVAAAAWKHLGDDAYSAGLEDGARRQNEADIDAIRALADPSGVEALAALRAQLEDAKAAQALVVERAAEAVLPADDPGLWRGSWFEPALGDAQARVRALADPTGVEALAALRAERDADATVLRIANDHLTSVAASRDIAWSKAATAEAERDDALARLAAAEAQVGALRKVLAEGRRAIGDHFAPHDCYATGPLTGDPYRDLVECPACSFIAMHDAALDSAQGGTK